MTLNLKKYRWLSIIVLAAFILISGYKRDRTFYYLNARIKYLDGSYHVDIAKNSLTKSEFEGTYDKSLSGLAKEKWWQTIKYTIIYFLITLLGLILFESDRLFYRYLVYAYLILIVLASMAYGLDYLVNINQLGYKVSMFLMHVLQSPLPLFIFLPAQVLLTYKKK